MTTTGNKAFFYHISIPQWSFGFKYEKASWKHTISYHIHMSNHVYINIITVWIDSPIIKIIEFKGMYSFNQQLTLRKSWIWNSFLKIRLVGKNQSKLGVSVVPVKDMIEYQNWTPQIKTQNTVFTRLSYNMTCKWTIWKQ